MSVVRERPSRGPCLNPGISKEGNTFRCRSCATCQQVAIDDWTGRCRAEMEMAVRTDMITLTYGDQYEAYGTKSAKRAKQLYPRDFTDFIKRLRRDHEVRYLACGELGSQKGRAHFHALLFWQSEPWKFSDKRFWWPKDGTPEKELKRLPDRHEQPYWLHGYIYPEVVRSARGVSYVTKYLNKSRLGMIDHSFHRSKSIGTDWICEHWAQLHVDSGIAPKNERYSFATDRVMRTGKAWEYRMHKDVQIKFARAFRDRWETQYPNRIMPGNDWLWQKLHKAEQAAPIFALDRQFPRRRVPKPTKKHLPKHVRDLVDVRFSDIHNCYYYICPFEDKAQYWALDEWGGYDWHGVIRGVADFDGVESLVAKQAGQAFHNAYGNTRR